MLRFAKRGQPMRAFHAISSPGIVAPTDANVQKLADLLGAAAHPQQATWAAQMTERSTPSRLMSGLDKTILRLKRGKSTDQHGWSAEAARIWPNYKASGPS
eukprot:1982456-Amphidinium_carterae.2